MKILILIYILTHLTCISMQIDLMSTSVSKFGKQVFSKRHTSTFFDRYTYYQFPNKIINKAELLKRINLAREKARKENDMRHEEEMREKIFRQYLAIRVKSSFIRDFHTRRF